MMSLNLIHWPSKAFESAFLDQNDLGIYHLRCAFARGLCVICLRCAADGKPVQCADDCESLTVFFVYENLSGRYDPVDRKKENDFRYATSVD